MRSRLSQMSAKEVRKNTERHTLLFLSKQVSQGDALAREELRHFEFVEELPLTKDILYVSRKKKPRAEGSEE